MRNLTHISSKNWKHEVTEKDVFFYLNVLVGSFPPVRYYFRRCSCSGRSRCRCIWFHRCDRTPYSRRERFAPQTNCHRFHHHENLQKQWVLMVLEEKFIFLRLFCERLDRRVSSKGRKSAAAPKCLQRSSLSTCPVTRCSRGLAWPGNPGGHLEVNAPIALFPKKTEK